LQHRVAVRALRAEPVPLEMPPHHARREQHRAAGARPLLDQAHGTAELAQARRAHEPGHAGARDDQASENVGLCSTYSTRTRSGPQTNTAYVFGASTTLSISIPRS